MALPGTVNPPGTFWHKGTRESTQISAFEQNRQQTSLNEEATHGYTTQHQSLGTTKNKAQQGRIACGSGGDTLRNARGPRMTLHCLSILRLTISWSLRAEFNWSWFVGPPLTFSLSLISLLVFLADWWLCSLLSSLPCVALLPCLSSRTKHLLKSQSITKKLA